MSAATAAPRRAAASRVASPAARLLRGLDFDVRAGECWAIVGPNGAGKTTLARDARRPARAAGGRHRLRRHAARRRCRRASARATAASCRRTASTTFPRPCSRRCSSAAIRILRAGSGNRPPTSTARAPRSRASASPGSRRATCARCPAASGGASRWRRSSRRTRRCCCWTSPRRISISASRSPRSTR